jgi:hypothetical protein
LNQMLLLQDCGNDEQTKARTQMMAYNNKL